MRITSIEPQQKNPSRRNIFADGEFLAGVSGETLVRLGLRVGDELDPDRVRLIEQTEELLSAKAAALRLLSVRPRTEHEIRDRLREKEFGDEEIARAIADMRSAGLLNDAEFARMYIRDALALKPAGHILLRRKLLRLGVDKETINAALDELLGNVDMAGEALVVARQFMKKSQTMRKKEAPAKLRNRTAAFLARRGFAWDIIAPVLKQLFTQDEEFDHGNE